jgi:hypothetical protein
MEPWLAISIVLLALVGMLAILKIEQTDALKGDNYVEEGR